MAAQKLGINSKLYYNSATYGTPTWVEVTEVNDLSRDQKANGAPVNGRDSIVDKEAITSVALSWAGTLKNNGSANFTKFFEAMLEREVLDVMVLDGARDVNGTAGHRADVQVFDASEDQGRGSSLYLSFMLKPTDSANTPKAVLVATGAPTFGPITGSAMVYA